MFLAGLGILIFSLSAIITMMIILYATGSFSMETLTIIIPFIAILFVIAVVGIVLMVAGLCMKRKVKRTTVKVNFTNFGETQSKVSEFLRKKGYKSITEHGENVWKCGVGFLTAMKYIKIEFAENNAMLVSGWVRTVGGNEQDLSGAFVCVVPKKQVMKVITEIQSFVI